jgi:hypothetical protein
LPHKNPIARKEYKRKLRAERIAEEKCREFGCLLPPETGKKMCKYHFDLQKEMTYLRQSRYIEEGKCFVCGKDPPFAPLEAELRCKDCCLNARFSGMHSRVAQNYRYHHLYYDIGICVDPEWAKTPEGLANFKRDMGDKYFPHAKLDRYPDKFGWYGPKNNRWATSKQNSQNCRTIAEVEARKDAEIASLHTRIAQLEQRKELQNV